MISNPQINLANEGIKKVSELIDYEQLSPEERTESKNRNAAESAKKIYEQEAERRRNIEIAKSLLQTILSNEDIAKHTGLTIKQVEQLRSVKE